MVNRHISRDYSAHKKSIVRPYDEYVKLEIFSFDPSFTKTYIAEDNTVKSGTNATLTSWKSWKCFKSTNKTDDMVFNLKYNASEDGEYRIDVIYEQSNHIYNDTKIDTGKDLVGNITITNGDNEVYNEDTLFDGENNIIKRIPVFQHLNIGSHNIKIEIPSNCYFMGVIIRKVIKFVGDNYYGDALGSEEGNLMLLSCNHTLSDMTKASELVAEIGYDDVFECDESPSGFYIDFMDEVNFYVKDDDMNIKQVFGGYVSSILPDSDRTKLTIHSADRLVDGQNKYILDQMVLQGGTKSQSDDEYYDGMTKNFDSYPQALKYLCDCHEVTLQSNISKDYTVDGEKFHKGVVITFGKNKLIKKISVTNGQSTPSNNYIMLRNNSTSDKQQIWTLYDASKVRKTPPNISEYGYMHLTYGLGNPKTEIKSKTSEKVDVSETTAGSQKFGKCGRSADGKYLMAIGQPSVGKKHRGSFNYNTIYKTIYENKCPHCGGQLVWDRGNSKADCVHCGGYSHSKREWGNISETEITCSKCCADFCSVTGWDKDGKFQSKYKLKKVGSTVKSSKSEQDKLQNGKMVAVPTKNIKITSDDIFKAITKLAFKYKYKRGKSSTWSAMKKTGSGDCWAFSELIFEELKKYNVSCKIVDYKTGASDHHRSVLYKDDGKWKDFPYREYGWDKKYNNMLNNTSKSKTGGLINQHKGNNIGNAQATGSTTKSQTTTVTTTKRYDNSKPFQGYFKLTYSLSESFSAKKYAVYIKLTRNATAPRSINTGLPVYWVNNTVKKTTLKLKDNKNLIDYLRNLHGEDASIYLQSIHLIAPIVKATKENEDTDWYKMDNQTKDYSSCKIDLYQIVFDDDASTESSELNSCGKSINDMIKNIVDDAGYYVQMQYGLHRKDDKILFRVLNQSSESYTASEGDNNNILSWNNISYSPVSSLFNLSMQVFKKDNGMYYYIDTREPYSILNYGEHCTLQTSNEAITEKEAYFNARMSDKFNPTQNYTYTITVPNYPSLRIGDLVKVIANAKKLKSTKEVSSIKIEFDYSKIPRIRTTIGLDELAPDIQLKKNIRKLRSDSQKESTSFSSSAIPVSKEMYYEWDR